ncbi:V-type proton ATPase 116 kDa subunit a 3-like isoform X2 [Conger conger]|uniref:V-type proton ATPase 116 kDa subunit a 3-like isoform X2 n=1 Tax=Conger conger TaxID=82655 RepID=UPI002A5A1B25|nr:V-type proton ATPase 116 kDa subunit a 3-like isoform X2 [Conger conger]
MGALFRSEEVCLVQLFLQSGSAYNCVSELGELGLVEFRDLNPNVNAFQRKFVGEVRRCEEMEKTFSILEQEINRSLSPPLEGPLPPPCPAPSAPQPRELLTIEEESERLARELKEVSRNRDSLRAQLTQLSQYRGVLTHTHSLTASQVPPPNLESSGLLDNRQDIRLSFVAGVVHPWKAPGFERLLWRACRGYIIMDFREMEQKLELPDTGEMVQWTVFLISYWGDQIGQKVKKICDCFHTHNFAYPESPAERMQILQGLEGRIEDIKTVLSQTEQYLQQLLARAVIVLPQWKVRVQKSKAVQMVLNLCSPSVTDKCLIAEAWCPVSQLPALQSALREGARKSGSGVESFYNRLPSPTAPPTLFTTNSFTAGFQSIVDAYGVASYREVNPAVYTIITFPFLFAVMFGDVGHGLLMTLAALWMVLEEKDPKLRNNTNEIWRMMFGGRYLILLMGLFSIYTGAVYNECFSRGLSPFTSAWHLQPMIHHYNWSDDILRQNQYLQLDPSVEAVFQGPYPFGIDPIWRLANNHLTFLNSYKMKMSVIIGVIHMTFGVCLSFFNYTHFGEVSSVLLVLIPELVFMLCLFGYLVFMIVYKWIAFGPLESKNAPSILIHFIDMFLFTQNGDNPPLYSGQFIAQMVLVIFAVCSVPVLLLGKPVHLLIRHRNKPRHTGERCPLLSENGSINALPGDVEEGRQGEPEKELDVSEVFMHQAIHTIEYCLGCISNTASYLRLWALSLAHSHSANFFNNGALLGPLADSFAQTSSNCNSTSRHIKSSESLDLESLDSFGFRAVGGAVGDGDEDPIVHARLRGLGGAGGGLLVLCAAHGQHPAGYGGSLCLPARAPSALGGISKQILQWNGL